MFGGYSDSPYFSKGVRKLSDNCFPLPWREGIKGRGDIIYWNDHYSPSPQPSPVEGEGVFGGTSEVHFKELVKFLII